MSERRYKTLKISADLLEDILQLPRDIKIVACESVLENGGIKLLLESYRFPQIAPSCNAYEIDMNVNITTENCWQGAKRIIWDCLQADETPSR